MCFSLSGLLSHGDLDERALDALKEFPAEGGIAVLKQFKEANLEHVGNKSAYLCGVMKTYRQKRQEAPSTVAKKGPDEAKLKVNTFNTYLKKSSTKVNYISYSSVPTLFLD